MVDSETVQNQLASAHQALDEGQPGTAVQLLRGIADSIELTELLGVLGRAASALGATEILEATQAAAADPNDPSALYSIGYMCVGQGLSYLAVPMLRRALQLEPENIELFMEFLVALEDEARHAEAVAVIEAHDDLLQNWIVRYFHVFNSIMSGDVARARTTFAGLGPSEEPETEVMHARVSAMMQRLELAAAATSLDHQDLRGWHYVMNGSILGEISPFGFESMSGRYAYTQDSLSHMRYTVDRLAAALSATEKRPSTVSLLPDRSSQILGLAVSRLLGLPAKPWSIDEANTLIVAYDLREVEQQALAEIRVRQTEQVLFEQATCWTEPGPVSADFSGFLHQMCVTPWAEDDRPAQEWADDIANATLEIEAGDGETPPDTDASFAAFASSVKAEWAPASGVRDRLWSPGPVGSSRFL
jgi:tetratricopeptide (TPR) repeat protein